MSLLKDVRRSKVVLTMTSEKGLCGVWAGSVAPPATLGMPLWYPSAHLDGVLSKCGCDNELNWLLFVAAGVAHNSAFFERECCLYIFHGLAVSACLSEVFLSALAHDDCLTVTSEVVWPEVTKPCD